jgi:hypothetical protein
VLTTAEWSCRTVGFAGNEAHGGSRPEAFACKRRQPRSEAPAAPSLNAGRSPIGSEKRISCRGTLWAALVIPAAWATLLIFILYPSLQLLALAGILLGLSTLKRGHDEFGSSTCGRPLWNRSETAKFT